MAHSSSRQESTFWRENKAYTRKGNKKKITLANVQATHTTLDTMGPSASMHCQKSETTNRSERCKTLRKIEKTMRCEHQRPANRCEKPERETYVAFAHFGKCLFGFSLVFAVHRYMPASQRASASPRSRHMFPYICISSVILSTVESTTVKRSLGSRFPAAQIGQCV